jgi:hypothetical protein
MPIPSPNKNEKKNDFISRCMGSEVMKKEFPNQDKRSAVCYSQYDKRKKKSKASEEPTWDDVENDGFVKLI